MGLVQDICAEDVPTLTESRLQLVPASLQRLERHTGTCPKAIVWPTRRFQPMHIEKDQQAMVSSGIHDPLQDGKIFQPPQALSCLEHVA
eukprot:2779939-Prymnesium_polylepis.3